MPNIMQVAYGTVAVFALLLAVKGMPGTGSLQTATPSRAAPVSATTAVAASAPVTAPPQVSLVQPGPARPAAAAGSSEAAWVTPDLDKLPDDSWGQTVRYGRDLITKTYALIGPEVSDATHRFSGNNMSCQNCHLDAGTKQFGIPFQGVYADFPNYRARSGAVGTIEDRIQGCMTRSMNGRALPPAGREMTALVAYLKFVSDGRPVGAPTPGRGPGKMPELSRAADPAHGKEVFAQNCAACHGADGLGKRVGTVGDAQGYTFPPLWGPDSFNDGAGMDRLIAAANFIHNNMPNGTTWQAPALSDQDSWDVAAYVQAQKRPQKANLDKDYPIPLERPADSGYGPYVDGFSQEQHRLGPFAPIRAKLKALHAAAPLAPVTR